jgi:hypothetical protein
MKGYEEFECSCCGEKFYKRSCLSLSLTNKNTFLNAEHQTRFHKHDKKKKKLTKAESLKKGFMYVRHHGFTDQQLKEENQKVEPKMENFANEPINLRTKRLSHTKTLETLKRIMASRESSV